jgi:hypothetical protein
MVVENIDDKMNKGKGKGHPRTVHEGPVWVWRYSSAISLTSALDWSGWSTPRPDRLTLGKRPGTHFIKCWVGPRAGLDVCEKSRPSPGFDPRTFRPVVTD